MQEPRARRSRTYRRPYNVPGYSYVPRVQRLGNDRVRRDLQTLAGTTNRRVRCEHSARRRAREIWGERPARLASSDSLLSSRSRPFFGNVRDPCGSAHGRAQDPGRRSAQVWPPRRDLHLETIPAQTLRRSCPNRAHNLRPPRPLERLCDLIFSSSRPCRATAAALAAARRWRVETRTNAD